MDTQTFYATASVLCFTLLGFWWIVVQFRHAELTRETGPRRFAFIVSLHFILPGLVSLASLLATGALWRVAFGLAGATGIAAAVIGLMDGTMRSGPLGRIARLAWLVLPLYAALTLVAVDPSIAGSALGLVPLQVEGLILVVVLLLGIMLAWLLFTEPLAPREVGELAPEPAMPPRR
jgi:hypothetical protein